LFRTEHLSFPPSFIQSFACTTREHLCALTEMAAVSYTEYQWD